MANKVFANGMEIACKAGAGKVIAAFPDVCMTPPENPATPPGVPVPYPNTAMASDTADGSKKVKISDKEVMLKNKSYFKKSTGDEAGCAAKKGVISSKNTGKVYFIKWSMDVKVEGENVDRHLDMTTNNHASPAANEAVPWPFVDTAAFSEIADCSKDKKKMDTACANQPKCPGVLSTPVDTGIAQFEKSPSQRRKDFKKFKSNEPSATKAHGAAGEKDANECVKKSRCYLRPYVANTKEDGCCPGQTPHHIPPAACFKGTKVKHSHSKALCICLEGKNQHSGTHGRNHAAIDALAEKAGLDNGSSCSLQDYNKICAKSVAAQFGCNDACIQQQLDESFKKKDLKKNIKHARSNSSSELTAADRKKMKLGLKGVSSR